MAKQNNDVNITHDKSWERPWSTDEIRQNAHNWNLAGDSGLLRHLQEFSQNVLTHIHSTGRALDLLVEDINTTATEINNVNNKFLCLANTQFVENRVYEDDDREVPVGAHSSEEKPKEETDATMLKKVKEALSMSVAVLDTMFEPVEIQASDSDEETEDGKSRSTTRLLEPHNPYLNRPLPYLIGSEAFMSDDKIGLGDSPSDVEERPFVEDMFEDVEASSESEIDLVLPSSKCDRDASSSLSSASGIDTHTHQTKKMKSSDPEFLSNTVKPSEPSIIPAFNHDPKSKFAEQLAAKLGNVTYNADHSSLKSPSSGKKQPDDLFGGPHSEEEEDDVLFKGRSGIFSDRPKLFDDLGDTSNMFWGNDEGSSHTPQKALSDSKEKEHFPKNDDLFGSYSDEEDDLFSFSKNNSRQSKQKTPKIFDANSDSAKRNVSSVGDFDPGAKTSTPQDDNHKSVNIDVPFREPSDVSHTSNSVTHPKDKTSVSSVQEKIVPQEKKPTGGVLMFGQASLLPGLKNKLPQRQSSPSSSSSSTSGIHEEAHESKSISGLPADENVNDSTLHEETSSSGITDSQGCGFSSHSTFDSSSIMSSTRKTADDGYQSRKRSTNLSDVDSQDLFQNSAVGVSKNSSNIVSDLFADVQNSEDDLFADDLIPHVSKTLSDIHTSSSIFSRNDDFEDLFSDTKDSKQDSREEQLVHKKDQASYFESSIGFAKPSNMTASSKLDSLFEHSRTGIFSSIPPPLKPESGKKVVSLFEDSDSGEDDLLFSSASSAGSRRSQASSDLLSTAAVSIMEKKPLPKQSLFDDDALFGTSEGDPAEDLFSNSSSKVKVQHTPVLTSKTPGVENENLSKENLFSKDVHGDPQNEDNNPGNLVCDYNASKSYANDDSTELPQKDLKQFTTGANDGYLFAGTAEIKHGKDSKVYSKSHEEVASCTHAGGIETLASEKRNDGIGDKNSGSTETSKKSSQEISKHSPEAKPKKPQPPNTLNIRNETDPSLSVLDHDYDGDDDLFSSTSTEPTSIVKHKDLFSSNFENMPTVAHKKPLVASKPVAIKNIFSEPKEPEVRHQEIPDRESSSEPDGSPSKIKKSAHSIPSPACGALQSSLKIDPLALLPGAKPPGKRPFTKESSPEESPKGPPTSRSLSSQIPHFVLSSESTVGFDRPISNNSTLPSTHKDRARLGSKRRPPSNKARREAARASQSFDDKSETDSPQSPYNLVTPSQKDESVIEIISTLSPSNNILSPSTDEDDLFGVPQDLPSEYGKQCISSADIFGRAPVLSPAGLSGIPSDHLFSAGLSKSPSDVPHFQQNSSNEPPAYQNNKPTSTLLRSSSERGDSLFPNIHSNGTMKESSLKSVSSFLSPQSDNVSALSHEIRFQQNSICSTDKQTDGSPEAAPNLPEQSAVTESPPLLSDIVDVDPLNSDQIVPDDDQLFAVANSGIDDNHSPLFPFVKKKSDVKDVQARPLFSKTPSFPSKEEGHESKSTPRSLDVDNDLFSSDNLQVKDVEGISNTLKSGSGKIWQLSDDDDDDNDLFSSGSRQSKKSPLSDQGSIPKVSTEKSKNPVSKGASEKGSGVKKVNSNFKDSLFGETDENENDDDGLFSKPTILSKKLKNVDSLKSSLFDEEDDDDDDLFGSSGSVRQTSSKGHQTSGSSVSQRTGPSSSNMTKLKPEMTFDDPLMALNRED